MSFSLDVTGIDTVLQAFQALSARLQAAAASALQEEADRILAVSQTLVPVDTGALHASGEIEPPILTGTAVSLLLRYGAHGRVPYAARIHEDTLLNHPRGGQAHYLSQPVYAATDGMATRVAAAIRQAVGA